MKANDHTTIIKFGATALFAAALGATLTLFATGNLNESGSVEKAIDQTNITSSDNAVLDESDSMAAEIVQLREELTTANEERRQLSESVLGLNRDLRTFEQQVVALEALSQTDESLGESGVSNENIAADDFTGRRFGGAGRRPFQQSAQERIDSLLAAGIDEQTARDLQARRDQYQLARLELIDQASREGWSGSDQLQQKLGELDDGRVNLQEELGNDAYDRYLYESGIPNRVSIASVISGSAASMAGLEVGDLIVSYNNERVFRVNALQQATRSGVKGEYVQVQFSRGGSLLSADLPRGPLGVTLSTTSVEP